MNTFLSGRKIKFLLTLVPLFCFSRQTKQQEEYSIKTLFIYNFTKYIEWPNTDRKSFFEIDVLGESDIIKPLEELARSKKINQKTIVIKVIGDAGSITGDMIFLPASESRQLGTVLKNCRGKNILVVTEAPNLAVKGSVINFKVIDNNIRFELNQTAAKNSGLKLSHELIELSIPVNAQ